MGVLSINSAYSDTDIYRFSIGIVIPGKFIKYPLSSVTNFVIEATFKSYSLKLVTCCCIRFFDILIIVVNRELG